MSSPEELGDTLELLAFHRSEYPTRCAYYLKKTLKSDMKSSMTFKVDSGTEPSPINSQDDVLKFNLLQKPIINYQGTAILEERVNQLSKALSIIGANKAMHQ